MKKLKKMWTWCRQKRFWLALTPIIIVITVLITYHLAYWNKIYPGIYLAKIPVGNLTRSQAEEKINAFLASNLIIKTYFSLLDGEETYSLELSELKPEFLVSDSVQNAFDLGRRQNFWQGLRQKVKLWQIPQQLPLTFQLDEDQLLTLTTELAAQINQPAIEPSITLLTDSQAPRVVIYPGQTGREIKVNSLQNQLVERIGDLNFEPFNIPFEITSPRLTDKEVQTLTNRATKLINRTITLTYQDSTWQLNETDLIGFLSLESFGSEFDQFKIDRFINSIATEIDRPAQNAILQFQQKRVMEFKPDQPGLQLDQSQANSLFLEALKNDQAKIEITLPVNEVPADITIADVNTLGIEKLLAEGESWFRGSIPNRVHNIKTAAEKLNGLLIPPGKEASFNESLGEVVVETGFKTAYVIKEGRTIPEIGGGVCQVSTTFFRAILQAGLEITERHAHAYRVSYYEQGFGPGIDATVYSPTADLKFINNTPGYLLVQTSFDQKNSHLVFEIYGTDDGRQVEITKPIILSRSDPPPPLYLPDPNLPLGTTKEVEHAIPGAKTIFYQKVTRNDKIILEDSFTSNYQAWQAIYMEGTKAP